MVQSGYDRVAAGSMSRLVRRGGSRTVVTLRRVNELAHPVTGPVTALTTDGQQPAGAEVLNLAGQAGLEGLLVEGLQLTVDVPLRVYTVQSDAAVDANGDIPSVAIAPALDAIHTNGRNVTVEAFRDYTFPGSRDMYLESGAGGGHIETSERRVVVSTIAGRWGWRRSDSALVNGKAVEVLEVERDVPGALVLRVAARGGQV